jgi:hypothetical protein
LWGEADDGGKTERFVLTLLSLFLPFSIKKSAMLLQEDHGVALTKAAVREMPFEEQKQRNNATSWLGLK